VFCCYSFSKPFDFIWILYLLTTLVIGSSHMWEMMLWLSVSVSCIKYPKMRKFRPQMRQNAFGGRAPPVAAAGAWALPRLPRRNWGVPTSKGRGKGRGKEKEEDGKGEGRRGGEGGKGRTTCIPLFLGRGSRSIAMSKPSVCPSDRQTHELWQTIVWKVDAASFPTIRMTDGDIEPKWPSCPHFKNGDFQSILVNT